MEKMHEYEERHLKTLRAYLPECTVLLKKDGHFPLQAPGELALYGCGARKTVKGGTGSGEVNSRYFVNCEEGLREAGFRITTTDWLNAYDEMYPEARKEFLQNFRKETRKEGKNILMEMMGTVMPEPDYDFPIDGAGSTCVYVVGRISGEGNDRKPVPGDAALSKTEIRDILDCSRKYENFMLVLNVGGVVDLTPVKDVQNILVLSQLGVETGSALSDILLGKGVPSGKLTTTWAALSDYCSAGSFGELNDTCYKEGIYVGYRYFESAGIRPMFPFGHGLSYTDFSIERKAASLTGSRASVTVSVKNTGKYVGKETAELYVSKPSGVLDQPDRELIGFKKTRLLQPGETEDVEISFDMTDIASYDAVKAAYVLEQGDYILHVGSSSEDTAPIAVISLTEDVNVRLVKNVFDEDKVKDLRPKVRKTTVRPEGVQVFTLDLQAVRTEVVNYNLKHPILPEVDRMSDEQLAHWNCGRFSDKGGMLSIVGNQGANVPGAAGETSAHIPECNFPMLVMADGPAGVRLAKEYYVDKKGKHAIGNTIPESMTEMLPGFVKAGMKLLGGKKPKGEVFTQYATAIPIGTALAQSFNLPMVEEIGGIVGEEAELFGVHLWLAPAMNIHRSILCGRNFEYYSEDPFVTGKIAAALTKGVQKYPHVGVTIKHFAANNQESNRYYNNSVVSERAMREIYLKGFEICVREAGPLALMSSYNLLNGIHTSERRDLIEDVLRAEWGYQGIVMTDWVFGASVMKPKGSVYRDPEASRTAMSGHELFMPGSKRDYEDILLGISDGRVTRKQLKINATRLLQMARRLNGK